MLDTDNILRQAFAGQVPPSWLVLRPRFNFVAVIFVALISLGMAAGMFKIGGDLRTHPGSYFSIGLRYLYYPRPGDVHFWRQVDVVIVVWGFALAAGLLLWCLVKESGKVLGRQAFVLLPEGLVLRTGFFRPRTDVVPFARYGAVGAKPTGANALRVWTRGPDGRELDVLRIDNRFGEVGGICEIIDWFGEQFRALSKVSPLPGVLPYQGAWPGQSPR